MQLSSLVKRLGGEASKGWEVHRLAMQKRARGEDVIVLSIGDPDFDTPAAITDCAIASLRAGRTHYASAAGSAQLRQAIAAKHLQDTGTQISPQQITVLPGAQCGLYSVLQCLVEPGCEVIVPEPRYTTYAALVDACAARRVDVALRPERNFVLDPADVEAAISDNTRVLFLNTPHNPTGAVLDSAIIEAIAAICKRYDLWLLCDQVYADICYENAHISPWSVPGMAERTALVSSLSKSHAMTGWRIGWVIAPPLLSEALVELSAIMLFGMQPFIQDAAYQALNEPPTALAQMRTRYQQRRDIVLKALAGMNGIHVYPPSAGMFMMMDIRPTGLSAQQFALDLLAQEDVAVLPGEAFGPSASGHIRISLCADEQQLRQACQRLRRFIATRNS